MRRLLLLVLLIGSLSLSVWASPEIDFDVFNAASGAFSYAGGGAALVATNVAIGEVVGKNTDVFANVVYQCVGCLLNFTTGGFTGSSAGEYDFASGGNITITGLVDFNGNGIADAGEPNGTLLSGSFTGPVQRVIVIGSTFKIAATMFGDTKNRELTAHYNLPALNWTGNTNLSFNASAVPPDAFTSSEILSGDIVNMVPEPAAFLLAGGALFLLAHFGRRRLIRR